MKRAGMGITGPAQVQVAVPVGRNAWASKQATLHYESNRLIKAEGIDLTPAGPNGVSGTLYVVKDYLRRDNRRVMRLERHKFVDGRVVAVQNWGELEDASPSFALATETDPDPFSGQAFFSDNRC